MSNQATATGSSVTVMDCLGRDHQRLDALLDQVLRMVGDGEMERAEHTFAEVAEGLERHVAVEEEILVPLFETRTAFGQRPVGIMQLEHHQIAQALGALRDALAAGRPEPCRRAHAQLTAHLRAHHLKEERFLYPAIDEVLTEPERTAMLHRLRRP